jgi:hypothetical protein
MQLTNKKAGHEGPALKRALGFYTCAQSATQGGSAANATDHIRKGGALKRASIPYAHADSARIMPRSAVFFACRWLFNVRSHIPARGDGMDVLKVVIPENSKVTRALRRVDFGDAYQVSLTRSSLSVEEMYRAIFGYWPTWIRVLMHLRGLVVLFGLRHPTDAELKAKAEHSFDQSRYRVGQRVGIFRIQSIEPHELIVGDNDKHLDFRIAVYKTPQTVTVATVVEIHNTLGRLYMLVVKPFHRLIVRTMVENAAVAGRL